MEPILKAPMFAAGAIAAAGVGAFALKGLSLPGSEKSIPSLISQDPSRRPIDMSEVENWKKVWQAYKDSGKDIWNIGNSGEEPAALKVACSEKLDSRVESRDSEGYKAFEKYCSRDTLVSDLIKENASGRALIAKASGSSEEWKAAWKVYKEHVKNSNKAANKDIWGLSDWPSKSSEENAPESFMTKCESNSKTPFHNLEGDLYIYTVAFCTKDKAAVVNLGG
ncbi:hypothetical protein MHF_1233 [Mycoplasma haemofelis Ohio2]|uniref:Uncharacterized protein n=1 Tax=Mycoplasma haemofelis (strain Ohio2) TaxID=859194 RepID=F6FFQ3_MYCHI|nr:hypothetical protein MHF_1233 [Mycoplasma haemofelis Ohio2]